jgi:aminopeptidase N
MRPVIDTLQRDYLKLLNANSYQKGGYVLYMLNQRLGDSAFHAGLRSYYAKHRDGNASSDDLRRELEAASGDTLSGFFDQWLRRPGVPSLSMGWAFDRFTRGVTVSAIQEGQADPYALRVKVVITDAAGVSTSQFIDLPADRRATVRLRGDFPVRPRSIEIDPGGLILGRLTRL